MEQWNIHSYEYEIDDDKNFKIKKRKAFNIDSCMSIIDTIDNKDIDKIRSINKSINKIKKKSFLNCIAKIYLTSEGLQFIIKYCIVFFLKYLQSL